MRCRRVLPTVQSHVLDVVTEGFHCSRLYRDVELQLYRINPLASNVATWVQHPVPDRVKPSFVIFDIWAL